jgi:regulator of sigma E protease
MEGSAAAEAGIMSGDVITVVDGQEVTGGWYHMSTLIKDLPGETVDITIRRGDSVVDMPVTIGSVEDEEQEGKTIGRIGVTPYVPKTYPGLFGSVKIAAGKTWFFVVHTLDFFKQLVTGKVSSRLLGGPVMIAQLAGESARVGLVSLLEFTAFISINLGVLNLLPFPVLDGGHIFVILVESAARRKLSPRVKNAIQSAGAFILLLFMLYVTFNDLMRLDTISRLFKG